MQAIELVKERRQPFIRIVIPTRDQYNVLTALSKVKGLTEYQQNMSLGYINGEYVYEDGKQTPVNPPNGFDNSVPLSIGPYVDNFYPGMSHCDNNWQRSKLVYCGIFEVNDYKSRSRKNPITKVPVVVFTVESRFANAWGGFTSEA